MGTEIKPQPVAERGFSVIMQSATKIVLLILTVVLALVVLYMCFTGNISGEVVVDIFDRVLMLVLGFYFAYKGDGRAGDPPYAGK